MNRHTQSLVLALVGTAVLRIAADGTFLRYVRPSMRPALLAAGVLLVTLGLVSVCRDRRLRPVPGPRATDRPDRGPWAGWLLLVPVLTIVLVAPPALGAYTANRPAARTVPAAAGDGYPALPSGDPVTLSLTDYYVRTTWDAGRSMAGRRIRLVGFVTSRPAGGFYLTRIAITCCAADATPVRISVHAAPVTYPPETWIAVVGRYGGLDPAARPGSDVPVIEAESVQPVPVPNEQYET